ncbi:putative ribonuclease H-like domain-containing protein [Tanacetum coccineum]
MKDNGRRPGKQEEPKALVTLDGEESYSKLKKLYDEQREQLSDASIEIQAYAQGLKKVEAQLVTHQNNQLWYEQKIRFDGILSYENEVLQSVFMNKDDNTYDKTLNDRFATTDGMHQPQSSEPDTKSSDFDSCESTSSIETPDCMPVPVVIDSKVVSTPKVWTDAPIIEEYESDSDDNPKVNKKDLNGSKFTRIGLGYGGTRKGCYVCGSFSHLIRDCDFHEKRMAKQDEMNKKMSKSTNQRDNRPIWNNVQRVNHLNQFVPSAVLTRSGKISVNTARASGTKNVNTARQNVSTARQNSSNQAVPTSTTRKVSTESTKVNDIRPKPVFHKVHSPTKRPFSRTTTLKTKFLNPKVSTARGKAVSAVGGIGKTAVKASTGCIWRPKRYYDDPQRALKNKGIVDSGCSRHMTGNKGYLVDYQDYNGGPVAFGGSKGQITGKGKIRTGKLDFEDVCFVKELQQFNLFSVSQMCDKKNKVLFTDTECLVLSPDFKLPDENQVLLKVPRQHNMYTFNLENFVPSEELTCLIANATTVNLTNGIGGLGKQHKASCKAKVVSSISQPLQLLHMDLFGPTSVRSINHKIYCLVITDDFSRFSWVLSLRTKDETSGILKDFIRQIENQLNKKVKTIRCDNGTKFKNREMIEFCGLKGIKREYTNARTPQQNGVAKRKNKTHIEAARTMLADSFLPNTFWAEAVSTAYYVLNRVLVTKPQNKTPYELITGKLPIISYIRPFGCHVTILNTIDHLGKFEEKADEGFLVGYSLNSKDFRVYNLATHKVEENLHVKFLENKPNVAGKGPTWLFDLDYLTDSMNYQPVTIDNRANKTIGPEEANPNVGTQDQFVVGNSKLNDESAQEHCVLPIWSSYTSTKKGSKVKFGGEKPIENAEKDANDAAEALRKEFARSTEELLLQTGAAKATITNQDSTDRPSVSTDSPSVNTDSLRVRTNGPHSAQDDSQIPALEDMYDSPSSGIFTKASYDDLTSQIWNPYIQKQRRNNHKDFQHCLFSCFLSQVEPKKISDALEDESWVDAMQDELLQFKIQKVWILVDLPKGKKIIGLKWVYRNKKDERGIVIRNKARLVSQGHTQEEGIDYDEVFAHVAWIEAMRIFLAFASYMGFIVYQMDVKSAFLYGTIDEELYVSQPPGFIDPMYPKKVYKVVKALNGLHQALRAWYATLSTFLLKNGYRRGAIDKTLFIKKDKKDIILVQVYVDDIIFGSTKKSWCDEFEALMKSNQDKYVAKMLKKFDFMNVKTASTPIETQRPLTKDEEATDVDVHLYRSMIGSLMYLTASRPVIMFAVCNCLRFQVTPKTSHLNAIKRIFRYLKGKPKLGLWYPRVSSFDLEAYSDSDYAGANLDRKYTTRGCQFLGRRLISWQCKKQTIVATFTTEVEYVAAASCCGQVLWIQNQMLDYGFNFMNTKIHIDNESTICIVKNPVFHLKTKHIKIRHHFIRDAYEKKLIQVLKIHTDNNVADLLTKAFDVSMFHFLVVSIGMINP